MRNKLKMGLGLILLVLLVSGLFWSSKKGYIKMRADTGGATTFCPIPQAKNFEGGIEGIADDPVNYSHWAYKYISGVLFTIGEQDGVTAVMNNVPQEIVVGKTNCHEEIVCTDPPSGGTTCRAGYPCPEPPDGPICGPTTVCNDIKETLWKFRPGSVVLRADVAILAARLHYLQTGQPISGRCRSGGSGPFSDVASNDKTCEYVALVKELGLNRQMTQTCSGTNKFCPYGTASYRELQNILSALGYDTTIPPDVPSDILSSVTSGLKFNRDFAAAMVTYNVPAIWVNSEDPRASLAMHWKFDRSVSDQGFKLYSQKNGEEEKLEQIFEPAPREGITQGAADGYFIDNTVEAGKTYVYRLVTYNRDYDSCTANPTWTINMPAFPSNSPYATGSSSPKLRAPTVSPPSSLESSKIDSSISGQKSVF